MSEDQRRHPGETPEVADLRHQVDEVERSTLRRVDPGRKAMVIAVGVLVLVLSTVLPWFGHDAGWQVALGEAQRIGKSMLIPRIFVSLLFVIGVLGSALALATRRWGLSWMCALGGWLTVVVGVLTVWTSQTSASHAPGPGPGIGLVLALVTEVVIAITWFRIVWSRD